MPASENGFQGLDLQRRSCAVNEFLKDLLQHLGFFEQKVAALFQLPDRIVVLEAEALLLGQRQGKTQAGRVEPARAQSRQSRPQVGPAQGAGQAVNGPVVGPFDETVARLGHAHLVGARLPLDPFVPIDNDLGTPRAIPVSETKK